MSERRAILWLSITTSAISTPLISSVTSPAGQAGVNLRNLSWQPTASPRGSRTTLLPRWSSSLKKRRANLGEFRRIKGIFKLQHWLYMNMQYRQASSHTVIQRSKRSEQSWDSICGHEERKRAGEGEMFSFNRLQRCRERRWLPLAVHRNKIAICCITISPRSFKCSTQLWDWFASFYLYSLCVLRQYVSPVVFTQSIWMTLKILWLF